VASAEDKTGLKRLLSAAAVYQAFQDLVGARGFYRRLVRDYLKLAPGARMLDIGCGPAAILGELPEGVEYIGFDSSERYIAAANRRWGTRGTFRCARVDEMALRDLPAVDLVLAVGVLHHLDDGEGARLFQLAHAALGSGGRVVSYDPCLIERQGRIARFLVSHDRGRHVRSPDGYAALARTAFRTVTVAVLEGHLRIPYTAAVVEGST
jgi:cyclopropane fatty-acyl-phospholipid synthase-like methyltransferase